MLFLSGFCLPMFGASGWDCAVCCFGFGLGLRLHLRAAAASFFSRYYLFNPGPFVYLSQRRAGDVLRHAAASVFDQRWREIYDPLGWYGGIAFVRLCGRTANIIHTAIKSMPSVFALFTHRSIASPLCGSRSNAKKGTFSQTPCSTSAVCAPVVRSYFRGRARSIAFPPLSARNLHFTSDSSAISKRRTAHDERKCSGLAAFLTRTHLTLAPPVRVECQTKPKILSLSTPTPNPATQLTRPTHIPPKPRVSSAARAEPLSPFVSFLISICPSTSLALFLILSLSAPAAPLLCHLLSTRKIEKHFTRNPRATN